MVKRLVMVILLVIMLSAVAAADTIRRDVLFDFNYTILSNNVTGNITFSYPNGTLIKTTVFNIGSTVQSTVSVSTNLSFEMMNASGGTVDCGDQTINFPAISCQPQYTLNEAACPALPALPNSSCEMTCPVVDNVPLQNCLASLDKQVNPEMKFYEQPWFIIAAAAVIIVLLIMLLGGGGGSLNLKNVFKKEDKGPGEPARKEVRVVPLEASRYEPQEVPERPRAREQAIPVSRSQARAPMRQPVEEEPLMEEELQQDAEVFFRPQPEPPRPVPRRVVRREVEQPVVRTEVEESEAIAALKNDLADVERKKQMRQSLGGARSVEDVKREEMEKKIRLLKSLRK